MTFELNSCNLCRDKQKHKIARCERCEKRWNHPIKIIHKETWSDGTIARKARLILCADCKKLLGETMGKFLLFDVKNDIKGFIDCDNCYGVSYKSIKKKLGSKLYTLESIRLDKP